MTCWGWNLFFSIASVLAVIAGVGVVTVLFCATSEAIVALRGGERKKAKMRECLLEQEVRGFELGSWRAFLEAADVVRRINEAADVPGGNNTPQRRRALECAEIELRGLAEEASKASARQRPQKEGKP